MSPCAQNTNGVANARKALLSGQTDVARRQLLEFLSSNPQNRSALHTLAIATAGCGDYSEAVEILGQVTKDDASPKAWRLDLAAVHSAAGHWSAAELVYADFLGHSPDSVRALCGLARARIEQQEFDHAAGILERALQLDPRAIDAYRLLGNLCFDRADNQGARRHLETLLSLDPNDAESRGKLILAYSNIGDLPGAGKHARILIEAGRSTVDLQTFYLYLLLYSLDETWQSIRAACQAFGDRLPRGGVSQRPSCRQPVNVSRPLRVGYLTGEFIYGAGHHFLAPLLGNHDAGAVEMFCYHTRGIYDRRTEWYSRLGHWRDCSDLTDEAVIDMIHDDRIEILVDLSGMFPRNRLGVFAQRAAPVQVTYPNCPMTTGIAEINYLLTDEWVCPHGDEAQYTEQAFRLPTGYLAYTVPEFSPEPTPSPFLSNGSITFGVFQRRAKMNPGVWDAMAEVLRQVPGSRLLIQNIDNTLDDPSSLVRLELIAEFGKRGVGEERLRFRGLRGQTETMALMATADIALDTFPYQGQTTTCECLWMGVPVVALSGDRHASRAGTAVLHSVGLGELAAESPAEYVRTARELAGNPAKLSCMRDGMRQRILGSPLLDGKRLAREVEAAYRWMWAQWCAGDQTISEERS
jgi:predicted O-linked N-acetylglucosamine transferase (SPINDLY family)